jgi:hypothetical protein
MPDRLKPNVILFCERVLTDDNGRKTLVSLFDQLKAKAFPASIQQIAVFVSIDGVHDGDRLRIQKVHGGNVEMELEFPAVKLGEASNVMQFVANLAGLSAAEPGPLWFRIVDSDNRVLAERAIIVTGNEEKPGEDQ